MIKSILIDARTPRSVIDAALDELRTCKLYGLDCETQDENRHAGLNVYNNKTRHVFDHRRTVMTGFSTYAEDSDTAYYFNLAHKDVENRLPASIVHEVLDAANPDAICVAHNAPFELVMFQQLHGRKLENVVCTLQMAVSHHGPDEYDLNTFYNTPLPVSFHKFARDIIRAYSTHEYGALNNEQQELLSVFASKTSKAAHSYNGFVKAIAKGYNLKQLTKNRFGYEQMSYETLLKKYGVSHMGQLTGDQVVAYGADDAYWAVMHYRWMFDEMLKWNPHALKAFFETENPMVTVYAEAWLEGIRLDLDQVFERRDIERKNMAQTLRDFKALIRRALPFDDEPHKKMLEKEDWYAKNWKAKRKQIEQWAKSADSDDDFTQCYQVSNPIGNAWAIEKGLTPPKGKLNLVHFHGMRTIMYDLMELPIQYEDGSVSSGKEGRGKIREKLSKDQELQAGVMNSLQAMSDIEQRMKLYLTPYTQLMDPETSRVYPSLSSQLATRRLATSFPNPMQLSKSGESAYIRSFYLGDTDDDVVISADWSAIELVLIGELSGGSGFRQIYGQVPYGDMHTGSAVDGLAVKWMPGLTEAEFKEFKFGRNPNDRELKDFSGKTMTPKDFYTWARGTAIGKGINFGYWYSGAVSTVANNLGLSSDEHWELVDRYRARFPEEEAWRVGVQEQAMLDGFIVLPDGHRRNRYEVTKEWAQQMRQKFVDISAAPGMISYAETAIRRLQGRGRNQVVNALIQGTCATLAKRTILNLRNDLVPNAGLEWGRECRLMMPIHDELVFSVKRHAVMDFIPQLRTAMNTHPGIVSTLPLNATVAIGRTFRPFNKADPKLSQIELDEAQVIPGVIDKELEGTKLSDDKVRDLLRYMFS